MLSESGSADPIKTLGSAVFGDTVTAAILPASAAAAAEAAVLTVSAGASAADDAGDASASNGFVDAALACLMAAGADGTGAFVTLHGEAAGLKSLNLF